MMMDRSNSLSHEARQRAQMHARLTLLTLVLKGDLTHIEYNFNQPYSLMDVYPRITRQGGTSVSVDADFHIGSEHDLSRMLALIPEDRYDQVLENIYIMVKRTIEEGYDPSQSLFEPAAPPPPPTTKRHEIRLDLD